MIGDGDEIEAAARGGVDGEVDGAGNHLSGLAGTLAVAMRCVHVQVAAEPRRPGAQRLAHDGGLLGDRAGARKVHMNGVMRLDVGANVRHADQYVPRALGNGSRQAGGSGVHQSHCER